MKRKNFIMLQLFAGEKLTEQSLVSTNKSQAGEQAQAEYSAHTIDKSRPKPDTSGWNTITAPVGTGGFGGYLTPFGCVEYLAGAKIRKANVKGILRMEALRHPSFDRFKIRFFAVYVPNSRIWTDADKFLAQNDSVALGLSYPRTVPMVTLPVNVGTTQSPSYHTVSSIIDSSGSQVRVNVPYHLSTTYRESIAYCYYGRMPEDKMAEEWDYYPRYFQKQYSVLPVRGYVALMNDCFIDRTSRALNPEWKESSVSSAELAYYFTPSNSLTIQNAPADTLYGSLQRASTQSHYWNSYRPRVYKDNTSVDNSSLFSHVVTQSEVDEWRLQAQNEDLSTEEVIAQIRGSRVASENRCRIIGTKTIDVDISLQPNTSEGELSLGADGALSYTGVFADFFDGYFEAPREGYIHYLWDVVASDDGLSAEAQNIEFSKSSFSEFYRPSLKAIKDRVMAVQEVRLHADKPDGVGTWEIGFVDNFSEYFRHPLYVRGDFPSVFDVGSSLGSRDSYKGFAHAYTVDQSSATTVYSVPSKFDWHALRAELPSLSSIHSPKVNMSDFSLHRLLLNRASPNISLLLRQRQLPQTFSLYGSVSLTIDQPIDASIKRNFIPFGEE